MNVAAIAGLVLSGTIAIVAALLRIWESNRLEWLPESRPGRLSHRLRQWGIGFLWAEALLIAVGSLLPTQARNDRILFISVWGIAGFLAVILVSIAMADSLLRLFVARAIVVQHTNRRKTYPASDADDMPEENHGPHSFGPIDPD
ncbi:hypothetical protein GC170_20265 [bacterium]|nr:hypothetical protein [bacterium]